ncbi:MAG TPA: SDR family oxidoreductase [Candidatus Tumulicola sp.]|nr:SDR family oxidoreductase [Candidatus Tumulicola sp.]
MSAPRESQAVDAASLFRLDGRVALVTGASSGLGARFARVLTAAGARVVLAARRMDRLRELSQALPGSLPVECDITKDSDVERLVTTALQHGDRIDVLVNNAGTADPYRSEDEPIEAFREVIALNLTAHFLVSQRVGRHMLERGKGSIINIVSVLGVVGGGLRSLPGYTASKAGLANLTRQLGSEWAGRGVRVNALAPGYFESELTEEIFSNEKMVKRISQMTPIGRPGLAHELDGPLLFLASDASSYVTGHILAVDGGWLAI